MSASHFSSRQSSAGTDKHLSYHLTLKHKNQTLQSQSHTFNNLPQIEIEATLDEPVYSGNSGMPLVKNFKMKYQCNFRTLKSANPQTVSGKIEGEVTAVIHGFCSRRKARGLAFAEAKKQIMGYFKQQL